MKNKLKVIVKKIKNWLSSLSKWAKKHIIPFILLLLIILSMCLTCFSRNIEMANASTTTVSSYYSIYIPYTQNLKDGNREYSSMLGTLQIDENGNFTSFTSYKAVGRDATNDTPAFNEFIPYVNNIIYDEDLGYYTTYVEMAFVNEYNTPTNSSCLVSLYGSSIPYTATYGVISAYQSRIQAVFYDNNDNVIFSIIYNLPYFNFTGYSYRFTPLIIRVEGSGDNYNLGYNVGYESGYNIGYEDGYVFGSGNTSPFSIIVNGVNSFLSINIFGNVSIADLLSLSFGVIMLGIIIKIFLGG